MGISIKGIYNVNLINHVLLWVVLDSIQNTAHSHIVGEGVVVLPKQSYPNQHNFWCWTVAESNLESTASCTNEILAIFRPWLICGPWSMWQQGEAKSFYPCPHGYSVTVHDYSVTARD